MLSFGEGDGAIHNVGVHARAEDQAAGRRLLYLDENSLELRVVFLVGTRSTLLVPGLVGRLIFLDGGLPLMRSLFFCLALEDVENSVFSCPSERGWTLFCERRLPVHAHCQGIAI